MRKLPALLLAAALPLAAQIGVPRTGFVRDATGVVRHAAGLPGSWVLPAGPGLTAASGESNALLGVYLTADRLVLLQPDGGELDSYPVTDIAVVVAFSPGTAAGLVWLETTQQLLAFPAWDPRPVPDWNGTPVSLALTRTRLRAVVRREDGLWLVESSLSTGAILHQRTLPGVEGPVRLNDDRSLLHSENEAIVLTAEDGGEQRVETPVRPETIERMGDDWVAIRCGASLYALHLKTMRLDRLPNPAGDLP